MRNQQDSEPGLVDAGELFAQLVDFLLREAGRRLIQQQEAGPADRGARELDVAASAGRQRACRMLLHAAEPKGVAGGSGLVLHPDHFATCQRQPKHRGQDPAPAALVQSRHDVLEHGQVLEHVGRLECSHQPLAAALHHAAGIERAAVEHDLAGQRMDEAADDVEQRRLSGPVGADQPNEATMRHVEADAGQHAEAAERMAHALDRKQRRRDGRSLGASPAQRCRAAPCGNSMITRTRPRPNRMRYTSPSGLRTSGRKLTKIAPGSAPHGFRTAADHRRQHQEHRALQGEALHADVAHVVREQAARERTQDRRQHEQLGAQRGAVDGHHFRGLGTVAHRTHGQSGSAAARCWPATRSTAA